MTKGDSGQKGLDLDDVPAVEEVSFQSPGVEVIEDSTPVESAPFVEARGDTAMAIATPIAAPMALSARSVAAMENGLDLFERFASALERAYMIGLKRTRPQDWVLSRVQGDGEEAVVGSFCATGYTAVAEVFGVQACLHPQTGLPLPMFGPTDDMGQWQPKRLTGQVAGVVGFEGWARGVSAFSGREDMIIATRWSNEDFAGRTTNANGELVSRGEFALESDLKSALLSLLKKKLVGSLAGLTTVPAEDLEAAWSGTTKSVSRCRKGHGFGSSSDRKARGVADDGVPIERQLLRNELLALVGGDEDAARDLLKELTAYEYKAKDGKKRTGHQVSVDRMTKGFMFDRAWERLRKHPTFGRDAPNEEQLKAKREALKSSSKEVE